MDRCCDRLPREEKAGMKQQVACFSSVLRACVLSILVCLAPARDVAATDHCFPEDLGLSAFGGGVLFHLTASLIY